MTYLLFKKVAFFWVIIHTVAYLSFKLPFTPSFSERKGGLAIVNYILTPNYELRNSNHSSLFMWSQGCYKCDEEANFYPFHKFKYSAQGYNQLTNVRGAGQKTEGFVGIFGYYGNQEFIVYVGIPLGIWLLVLLYRKLFQKN